MDQCEMMSHIDAARSLFFMREGFVFHQFCTELFQEVGDDLQQLVSI